MFEPPDRTYEPIADQLFVFASYPAWRRPKAESILLFETYY